MNTNAFSEITPFLSGLYPSHPANAELAIQTANEFRLSLLVPRTSNSIPAINMISDNGIFLQMNNDNKSTEETVKRGRIITRTVHLVKIKRHRINKSEN